MEQAIHAYHKITGSSSFRGIERVRKKRATTRGRRCFVLEIEIWGKKGRKPAPFPHVMPVRKGENTIIISIFWKNLVKTPQNALLKNSEKTAEYRDFPQMCPRNE